MFEYRHTNVLATLPCGHIRHFTTAKLFGNKKDVGVSISQC